MNVSIWNKRIRKWLDVKGVSYIVNISNDVFKLDGVEYDKSIFEINFVHEVDK